MDIPSPPPLNPIPNTSHPISKASSNLSSKPRKKKKKDIILKKRIADLECAVASNNKNQIFEALTKAGVTEGLRLQEQRDKCSAYQDAIRAYNELQIAEAKVRNPDWPRKEGNDPTYIWKWLCNNQSRQVNHVKWPNPDQMKPYPSPGKTRFVIISDTHCKHDKLNQLPVGDVLIHCGDMTMDGSETELRSFAKWLAKQPFLHKILISGNHETTLDGSYYQRAFEKRSRGCTPSSWKVVHNNKLEAKDAEAILLQVKGVTYLKDQLVIINGISIYGSPWQPSFNDWAFNLDRGPAIASAWKKIPNNIDILVTHGPPLGYNDWIGSEDEKLAKSRSGCEDLLYKVEDIKPKLHVFGHVHEAFGASTNGKTIFVNASTCTEKYKPSNPPYIVDLPNHTNRISAIHHNVLEKMTHMATIPSVTTSRQTAVINLPLDTLWNLIRPCTFEWQKSLIAKTDIIGSSRSINYLDKAQQTIQVTEISDRDKRISWSMVASEPSVMYTSRDDTICLTEITALNGFKHRTFIEWNSEFSSDATAEVIVDGNLKKSDAFCDLADMDQGKCSNTKCKCPNCSCGSGCTCGVSPEVVCDPCKGFKVEMAKKKQDRSESGKK